MNLKEIGIRLSAYMRSKNLGINQLGRMSKMSGAQVANILNAKNYGFNKLLNILNVCPDLNVGWLLEGKGSMLKTTDTISTSSQGNGQSYPQEVLHYQQLTLEAYKNSVEILSATNKDLRDLLEYYKKQVHSTTKPT